MSLQIAMQKRQGVHSVRGQAGTALLSVLRRHWRLVRLPQMSKSINQIAIQFNRNFNRIYDLIQTLQEW